MTGRSEFIEKYFEVVRELTSRGFNVAMMDWRGQGQSSRFLPVREKGHVQNFGVYASDLARFASEVVEPRFAGPHILMTHSMGGAPALQLLAAGETRYAGAVLVAPMTRLFDNPLKRMAVRGLVKSVSFFGGSRQSVFGVREHSLDFEGNNLTSDRVRHGRFRDLQAAAPEAAIREPTYGWLRAAYDAMDALHIEDAFATLRTPVLIVSAGRDELVSSADHARLASRSPLIERVVIEDALHEILMERDDIQGEFWTAFDLFIKSALEGHQPKED